MPNTNDCEGGLCWFKPGNAADKFYPAGLTITNDFWLVGSRYTNAPPWGSRVLNCSNAVGNAHVIFGDGNLSITQTNSVTLGLDNLVTVVSGSSSNLSLKLNVKTGGFSGSFKDPATASTRKFAGVLLQIQNFGAGCFSGTNETGWVSFEPVE